MRRREHATNHPRFPRLRCLPSLFLSLLALLVPAPAAPSTVAAGDDATVAEHLRSAGELREEGRLRKARRELERADRAASGASSQVAAALARLALDEADPEAALAEAKRALDLATTDAERAEAWVLAGLVRLDAARVYEIAAERSRAERHRRGSARPDDAEREHDAELARELARAEEAFSRALEIAQSRAAHVHLARIHLQRGDLVQARAELTAAGTGGEGAEEEDVLRACLGALEGQDRIYDPSGAAPDLQPPERLETDPPRFRGGPPRGHVMIRSVIDTSGTVVCAQSLGSSDGRIADAALEAVRSWRFEPATRDGEPVPVSYYLTMNFLRN